MSPWCADCGEPCEAIDIDVGYGVTEYWGAVSNHEDWIVVSDCCEADLIHDEEERDNLLLGAENGSSHPDHRNE